MTTLACPDCGSALLFSQLTNLVHICECRGENCRASVLTHGKTRDEAAEKFVQRCERFGYTKSLEERLREVLQGELFGGELQSEGHA